MMTKFPDNLVSIDTHKLWKSNNAGNIDRQRCPIAKHDHVLKVLGRDKFRRIVYECPNERYRFISGPDNPAINEISLKMARPRYGWGKFWNDIEIKKVSGE